MSRMRQSTDAKDFRRGGQALVIALTAYFRRRLRHARGDVTFLSLVHAARHNNIPRRKISRRQNKLLHGRPGRN